MTSRRIPDDVLDRILAWCDRHHPEGDCPLRTVVLTYRTCSDAGEEQRAARALASMFFLFVPPGDTSLTEPERAALFCCVEGHAYGADPDSAGTDAAL